MTKGSLIEYQALKIAKLEQEIEKYRIAIAAQLWGNSGGCVANLRCVAGELGITKEMACSPVVEINNYSHTHQEKRLREELHRLDELMALHSHVTGVDFRYQRELINELEALTGKIVYYANYPVSNWMEFPELHPDIKRQIAKAAEFWMDLPDFMYPEGWNGGTPSCVGITHALVRLKAEIDRAAQEHKGLRSA